MKKFLLLMLGVLMSLPTFALEFDYEYKGQTLTYTTYTTADGKEVVKLEKGNNEVSGDLEIPSKVTYNDVDYEVKSFRNNAFEDCIDLTSVIIPESITEIGYGAFRGCSSLTSITLPESTTEIGIEAFYGCSALPSITIPEGVTYIGWWAFSRCSSLTSINIPDGVTEIGVSTFYNCSSLTSITIPEGVTSIDNNAFAGCSSLTSITIPEGVTSIDNSAFSRCSSLTSINIPERVTEIAGGTFADCSSLTSITIPEGVTSIGTGAFEGCSSLTSINIPEGVTSIANSAFKGCSALTSVVYKANDQLVEADSKVFDDSTYESATLYLTDEGLKQYDSTNPWKNFKNVRNVSEYDSSTGIDDITADFDAEKPFEVYNLSGVKVADNSTEGLAPGIYIRRQGNTTEKLIVK